MPTMNTLQIEPIEKDTEQTDGLCHEPISHYWANEPPLIGDFCEDQMYQCIAFHDGGNTMEIVDINGHHYFYERLFKK